MGDNVGALGNVEYNFFIIFFQINCDLLRSAVLKMLVWAMFWFQVLCYVRNLDS